MSYIIISWFIIEKEVKRKLISLIILILYISLRIYKEKLEFLGIIISLIYISAILIIISILILIYSEKEELIKKETKLEIYNNKKLKNNIVNNENENENEKKKKIGKKIIWILIIIGIIYNIKIKENWNLDWIVELNNQTFGEKTIINIEFEKNLWIKNISENLYMDKLNIINIMLIILYLLLILFGILILF